MTRSERDMVVYSIVLSVAVALYIWDQTNLILFYSIGASLLFAGMTHATRRILFNQLDLQLIAKKACETPTGAGMVFLGMILIMTSLIWLPIQFLKS